MLTSALLLALLQVTQGTPAGFPRKLRLVALASLWGVGLGSVVSADEGDYDSAKKYYKKAIEVDNTYNRARMNLVAMLFDQVQKYVDEMNGLGTSAADDKRYDELNVQKNDMYKEAVPYLKDVLENEPNNYSAAKTLMEIYGVLDDQPNFNAMKAKVDSMQEN